MTKAWTSVFGNLDAHIPKPRTTGITMLLDKYLGPSAVSDYLHLMGDYIDHWKLTFGTSALMDEDRLREKIATVRTHDILVYPGGTLTEVAIARGVCRDYMRHTLDLGFNGVEISDGTIRLSSAARHDTIQCALDLGLTVVAEVGKKDPAQQQAPEKLAEQALVDLESGAAWVIIEARESGRGIGVYADDGAVRGDDVEAMTSLLGAHGDRVIWEAPLKRQYEYFILRYGPNVCLGNIAPGDVLAVEAMRVGLRFETFQREVDEYEEDTFR